MEDEQITKNEDTNELMPPPSLISTKLKKSEDVGSKDLTSKEDANNPKINYTEPKWGGWSAETCFKYQLEVLKSGVIIEKVDVFNKGAFLVGRLPFCDVIMDHPSVSRQHAILQHRQSDGELFLYDLNSTHGTRVNKKRIEANTYTKVHNGDVIRFGESSRLFILSGGKDSPQEEKGDDLNNLQERISRNNALAQKYREYQEKKQQEELLNTRKKAEINFTGNWDEAEDLLKKGEKGEEQVQGKGNNAKSQEEEEENLDWMETSRVHSVREGEEEDLDDNDDFYDRTKKDTKRTIAEVETFESLQSKKETLLEQMRSIETTLSNFEERDKDSGNANLDSLDSYMDSLATNLKTEEYDKLKREIGSIKNELERIEKLLKISAPALQQTKKKVAVSNNSSSPTKIPSASSQAAAKVTSQEEDKQQSSKENKNNQEEVNMSNPVTKKKQKITNKPPLPPPPPAEAYDDDIDYQEVPMNFYK